jgi:hypothetical protein
MMYLNSFQILMPHKAWNFWIERSIINNNYLTTKEKKSLKLMSCILVVRFKRPGRIVKVFRFLITEKFNFSIPIPWVQEFSTPKSILFLFQRSSTLVCKFLCDFGFLPRYYNWKCKMLLRTPNIATIFLWHIISFEHQYACAK